MSRAIPSNRQPGQIRPTSTMRRHNRNDRYSPNLDSDQEDTNDPDQIDAFSRKPRRLIEVQPPPRRVLIPIQIKPNHEANPPVQAGLALVQVIENGQAWIAARFPATPAGEELAELALAVFSRIETSAQM